MRPDMDDGDGNGNSTAAAVGVEYDDSGELEEEAEEEEYEVEELVDDAPMHIYRRLFLGSIDAARNEQALSKARIAFTLALLGAEDRDEGIAAAPAPHEGVASGAGGAAGVNNHQLSARDEAAVVMRTQVAIEDALDEDLFHKLPMILAALNNILCGNCSRHCEEAERADKNVLVHCVAGRSRSPSVVAAWLLTQSPGDKYPSIKHVIDEISFIRPWIEINAHFQSELQLFHAVVASKELLQQDTVMSLMNRRHKLPRVDFGESLVADILAGKKTITMRLQSDLEDDCNSDLKAVFPHSTVFATTRLSENIHNVSTTTTTSTLTSPARQPFAVLYVQQVTTKCLHELDTQDLQKSGFASVPQVLVVLKQFYPHVTDATPLLMLHFACIGQVLS